MKLRFPRQSRTRYCRWIGASAWSQQIRSAGRSSLAIADLRRGKNMRKTTTLRKPGVVGFAPLAS